MKDSDPDNVLALRVWVMQCVVILLVVGVLVFFGIAVFIRNGPNPPKAALIAPALTLLGMGCAVLAVALHYIIPPLYVAIARKQIATGTWNPSTPENPIPAEQFRMSNVEKFCHVYQLQLAIRATLLAWANFTNLAAYTLEGDVVSLVVVALLLTVQLLHFPTRDRAEHFLSEQGELLRHARQTM